MSMAGMIKSFYALPKTRDYVGEEPVVCVLKSEHDRIVAVKDAEIMKRIAQVARLEGELSAVKQKVDKHRAANSILEQTNATLVRTNLRLEEEIKVLRANNRHLGVERQELMELAADNSRLDKS